SYRSPEQVAGRPLDPRSDLFSLGVMLYEMVTGRKPFTGDSVITITYNIMNLDPAAPPGVPRAVQAIVRRAMAKDPAQRYPDAGAMGRDLEAAASGRLAVDSGQPANRPGAAVHSPSPIPTNNPQSSTANPFANLRPDDLVLAPPGPRSASRRRPRPALSPVTRAWINALCLSILAAAVVLGGVWGTMVAYESYQSNASRQAAMAHFTVA